MSGGHGRVDSSNKKIDLLVAVLAAFLAVSEMGGTVQELLQGVTGVMGVMGKSGGAAEGIQKVGEDLGKGIGGAIDGLLGGKKEPTNKP